MQNVLIISQNVAHVAAVESAMRIDGRSVRSDPTVELGLLTARAWRPAVVLVDLDLGLTAGGMAALLRDPQVRDGLSVIATRVRYARRNHVVVSYRPDLLEVIFVYEGIEV